MLPQGDEKMKLSVSIHVNPWFKNTKLFLYIHIYDYILVYKKYEL